MISIQVFDEKFRQAVSKTIVDVQDLTIPFKLITESWYKGNKAIFTLKGPGKYADLTDKYKEAKRRRFGSEYPILKATGRLEKSMTGSSSESVAKILNKQVLVLGTTTPYALFLHKGTRRMPARPILLLGAEQVAPASINKRRENWVKLIQDFVVQKAQQNLGGQ